MTVESAEPTRYPALAAELVRAKVDVIVAGDPYALRAGRQATGSIPIAAIDLESDPVESGLVASVARPGGNVTGIFLDLPDLSGKLVELLREAVPGLGRVAVLWDPGVAAAQLEATEAAARSIGVETQPLEARAPKDLSGRSGRSPRLRRLGAIAAKVVKGARPAELPIERPARFDLVVNLRTARALGLAIPQPVLLRAPQLVE